MYNRKKVGLQILIAKKQNIKSMEDFWCSEKRKFSYPHASGGRAGGRV
jgi:hypothetical protein